MIHRRRALTAQGAVLRGVVCANSGTEVPRYGAALRFNGFAERITDPRCRTSDFRLMTSD